MTTAYTSLLGLALPVTGELAGTWGDTVNDYITQYLDSSVAGTQTISGSQTAVTLSKTTNAALSQVGSGATGSAQYNIINCTGNPASLLTITAPAASKTYLIINATSTSQSVKIVGTGPTTGVTLIAGERALVAWNGSDFIKVATTAAAGGSNTQVQFNNNGVLAGSAGLTWDGTTLVASNLTDSSLTSGRVTYATTGGNLTDSANLTFDGTNLTLGGGTANGVAYLNASKVLTTGSALSFDGTTLANSSGGTPFSLNRTGAGTALIELKTNGTVGSYLGTEAANNFTIYNAAGGQLATFNATGLGIGTSSPGVKLDVVGTGDTSLRARTTGTVNSASVLIYNGNGTTAAGYSYLRFVNEDTNTQDWRIGTYGNNNLSIVNAKAGTTPVVLDTSGNLGIGTSSPISYARLTLEKSGGDSAIALVKTGGAQTAYLAADGTNAWIGSSFGSTGKKFIVSLTAPDSAATIDPSGNLGLGVTPSAWDAGYKAIQIASGQPTALMGSGNQTELVTNAYYGSAAWRYVGSSVAASRYSQQSGVHYWFTAPSGTAGNAISFTQAMTLDASGNLVIGDTSASYRLDVKGSTGNGIAYRDGTVTNYLGTTGSNLGYLGTLTNHPVAFLTNATERARITSGGYFKASNTGSYVNSTGSYHELVSNEGSATAAVYIRNTNATSPAGIDLSYSAASPNGTGNTFLYCQDSTALRASIRSNGGIANYQANDVNLSDQRLKTDIQPSGSYLDKICAIPVKTFLYKDQTDTERNLGVMAQDVDAVAPEFIDHSGFGEAPEGESPYLAVYQTDLQYALMKCIQELKAQNDDLRARVAQLEAK